MTAPHEETIHLLRTAAGHGSEAGRVSGVSVDDVLRRGAARRARQSGRRVAGATALGTAVVIAAAMMGTAALSGPDTAGPAGGNQSQGGAIQSLALLGRAAVEEDRLPTFGEEREVGASELSPDSARLLTTAGSVGYYAGTNAEGEVCVAVHLEIQVASSCADLDRFAERGVWVQGSNDLGYDVTALLLPDHLSSPDPGEVPQLLERAGIGAADDYEVLAPNLIAASEDNR